TYLPVRAVGEAVGLKVGWNAETQTVVLGEGQPAEKVPEGSYKVGDFTFTDVTVKSGIIGPEIAAEVKSSKDVKGATFTITFYGADDKRIGTAMGSVQNLKSGESKTLQFMTSDDGVEKYKSMKFQVDLQY
ncbi:MAG: hypothetical protein K0R47_5167, partial [Brevibacillus sp.]|nr:hypothetical protein [Brevibacillus sp.]